MYSSRRKRTERLKEFWHRHQAKHRAKHNRSDSDNVFQSSYPTTPPVTRAQSASPQNIWDDDFLHDVFYDNSHPPIHFNSPPPHSTATFSQDYERYMRMRDLNMERIRQLNQVKSNNPSNFNTNMYSPAAPAPALAPAPAPTNTYPNYSNYTPNYASNYAPNYTNPTYNPSTSKPTNYTLPNSASTFSKSSSTGISKGSGGISAIEQELLDMVALDSPFQKHSYSSTSLAEAPTSVYNYAPYPSGSLLAPPPTYDQGLSPRAELERFRASFAPAPSATALPKTSQYQQPYTTTTTTTTSTQGSWSPQPQYPRYEIPEEYNVYQQHDKEMPPNVGLSREHSPNLRSSYPGSLNESPARPSFDPYNHSYYDVPSNPPVESGVNPLHSSYSDYKLSPINEDPYAIDYTPTSYYNTPSPIASTTASEPIVSPVPAITVSEPLSTSQTVEGLDGKPISLQEDLQNLLQNLDDHFKRRPSGIPKAPPPSPADAGTSPTRYSGETIFPDFDFTRADTLSTSTSSPRTDKHTHRSTLAPRSLAFNNSISSLRHSGSISPLRNSSESITPTSSASNSIPSSPIQFHFSPAQSDSEYYTPPHSPKNTTARPLSAPQTTSVAFSPALPPPPPLSPLPYHQELNCQGNFPSSPPAPLPFHDADIQSLPPPIIPPPDFDYSAYDFQGNRLDRPPEYEENVEIAQPEEIAEVAESAHPLEESQTQHETSVVTETSTDPFGKTVTSTITSNTSSASTILSTVSTATTTKSSSAIPTSPSLSHDTTTVIETVSTVTTALEPETGKVANARMTQTKVLHPNKEGDDEGEITNVTREYNEGFLPCKPPADPFSMTKLLEDIRNGKSLRKTPAPNYATLPAPTSHASHADEDVTVRTRNALVHSLASRRAQINDDESEIDDQEEDEDREWMWV